MAPTAPARTAARPAGRALAAVALVGLICTGCSNAPATTGGTDDVGDRTGPVDTPAPVDPQELQKRLEAAECMRENGVEDFPDPDANGLILYYGDDPDMESASAECAALQPVPPGAK